MGVWDRDSRRWATTICTSVLILFWGFPARSEAMALEPQRKPAMAGASFEHSVLNSETQHSELTKLQLPQPLTEGFAARQFSRSNSCQGLGRIVRKSVTDMSTTEWNRYVAAFNRMKRRKTRFGISVYDNFARIHQRHAIHRQAAFLPWHREMLWQWDRALAVGTPKGQPPARQPYFEWAASPRNPFVGIVSRRNRYGGNGMVGGSFGRLISNFPRRHRVRRRYDNSIVLTNSRTMNLLRTRVANFERFRVTLEEDHDAFHVRVGGDMTVFQSPNDPYFYAHHAYIDKIYREWQLAGKRRHIGLNWRRVMRPWPTTARLAVARGRCVRYQPIRNASATGDNESSARRRRSAVAAAKTAAQAARRFGASQAEINMARRTTNELLREEGIDISGED